MEKTCTCGKRFSRPTTGNPDKKFCSTACRYEAKNATRRAQRGNKYGASASMNIIEKRSEETEKIDLSPAGWAAWVFKSHDLDGSKQQLVMLGLEILTVARDSEEDIKTRMNAMGRFQAILSQLNLPKLEVEDEVEDTPIISVVRPSVDPRKHLRVVS